MTELEKFLASSGLHEEPFELTFNGARLTGVVKIHPARKYREIMQEFDLPKLADQFLTIEDRQPLFNKELEALLPDVLIAKLCNIFIKANTGRDPEKILPGELASPAGQEDRNGSAGSSLPNFAAYGILTRLKIAALIVFSPSGKIT
jgi:hypothetical protein